MSESHPESPTVLELGPQTELSLEDVYRLGLPETDVRLSERARQRIEEAHEKVNGWIEDGRAIYGITTGVGELLHNIVPPEQSAEMSENICHSHAVGVSDDMDPAMVRRAMGVRLQMFAQGHSGVQLPLAELLAELINRNVTPVVPEKGTVSASGDLNPLAHVGAVLTGEGEVFYEGEKVPTMQAFEQEGLEPISLGPKEGLSCMNGTTATTPMSVMAVREAERMLQNALLATTMTMEVLQAGYEPLDPDVLGVRPHPGMLKVGEVLRETLDGSDLVRHKEVVQVEFDEKLDEQEAVHTEDFRQDSYSIRGIPQILGPSVETYHECRETVETEVNAIDDNPVVFPEREHCLHSAQFHAQPLAQAMDQLKIAVAEAGVLCERQAARILDPATNKGLPAFLAQDALSCGFEGAQYVAGSMVGENRILASPVSIQSLSLNAQFQDVVSMGLIAGKQARQMIENVNNVLDFELMCAAQAAEERGVEKLSPVSQTVHERIRSAVPSLDGDRMLTGDFDRMRPLTREGELVAAVEDEHGGDLLSLDLPAE